MIKALPRRFKELCAAAALAALPALPAFGAQAAVAAAPIFAPASPAAALALGNAALWVQNSPAAGAFSGRQDLAFLAGLGFREQAQLSALTPLVDRLSPEALNELARIDFLPPQRQGQALEALARARREAAAEVVSKAGAAAASALSGPQEPAALGRIKDELAALSFYDPSVEKLRAWVGVAHAEAVKAEAEAIARRLQDDKGAAPDAPAGQTPRRGSGLKKSAARLGAAAAILGLDQASKAWAVAHVKPSGYVPALRFLDFTYVENHGAAWGLGAGHPAAVTAFSIASLALVIVIMQLIPWLRNSRLGMAGSALLLGGALGNILDRLARGYVVDFIDFRVWPVFNLADAFICLASVLILVATLSARRRK